MSVVEEPPPPFDASKFVTYQTDELTTPTEKELIEDLPEWEGREAHQIKVKEKETKPRRGVGFLRAEPSTDTEESHTEDSSESDFGAGLDEAELKAIAAKNTERPKQNRQRNSGPRRGRSNRQSEAKVTQKTEPNDGGSANEEKDGDKTPGRKRRRRRGRRNRRDSTPASGDSGPTTQDSSVTAPASASAGPSGTGAATSGEVSGDQSGPASGEKRKPRRRRRRGGRNRSNPGNSDSSGGATPAAE